jgi:anion-transporting  ArsA/GET3 family ATPase
MGTPLLERTLLYVTGKGGVGKTTVAAALGLAAAARGRRTIVCEVAEQDRVSRAFAREGVRAEREVRLADNLWAITIDPTEALREWLARQLGGPALRLVTGSSTFQHFVAAAPGAKELITIAKVWELAQLERWDARNRSYDLVVVDAPASGHGVAMLTAPHTFGEIARVGPVRRQAFKVRDMLSDPARTGYVAVALPEEMPVNETLELGRRLEDAVDLGLDAIVMNGLYPERFTAREADALRAAAANGLTPDAVAAVRAALTEHERARTQRAHLRRLKREADAPVFTLPFLFEAEVGLAAYRTLAAKLGRDLERAARGRASRPAARPGPARAT